MADNKKDTGPVSLESHEPRTFIVKFLDSIEWIGNKLPDPAVLFLIGLVGVWVLSAVLTNVAFTEVMPGESAPIKIVNLLTFEQFATFLSSMVETFVHFHPLGVVLVALLGVGVAEKSGFINAVLKAMLNITPKSLLTPMLILVAIVSHTAADAGYVLVIPIGGVMFYAAGRHPLAGIAAAFAGVSGGFSANFIPSGIDPLLSNLTQEGADLMNTDHAVNPLCNIYFTAISSIVIIGLGWFLTDYVIEPRLKDTEIDGDPEKMPKMEKLSEADKRGMIAGLLSILVCGVVLVLWAYPSDSSLRDPKGSITSLRNKELVKSFAVSEETPLKITEVFGPAKAAGLQVDDLVIRIANQDVSTLAEVEAVFENFKHGKAVSVRVNRTVKEKVKEVVDGVETEIEKEVVKELDLPLTPTRVPGAPIMSSIVPIIFLFFIIPGLVHGYISGTFTTHRDVVKGMAETMETMGYYMVLVFFAALFIKAFGQSNIGKLVAIKGANFIEQAGLPAAITIMGIIILSASVNLLVGSASAKWAMLAPIFVPMLMKLGMSPELTQAAYRVGDSSTNIITPMMPYFPLVVVFCQRYVKKSGVGTVGAMMLPYSIVFLIGWTIFLLIYWQVGIPLGIDASYTVPIEG